MLLSSPLFTPFFLALRNMRARFGRTALTLLGILLGVAVVLATQITNRTTIDSLRQVFDRATGQASLIVIPSAKNGDELTEELLYQLEKSQAVQVTAPSIRAHTLLASQADTWQIEFSMGGIASGNMFLLYGIEPELDAKVRIYQLCLLYTSPSPRDRTRSRMPSSA